jgi:ATP-binding cassette subfamily F protein uup
MDRMVDHLFAFEGDGVIKDFPGNYTLYRQWKEQELTAEKNTLPVDRGPLAEKQAPAIKAEQRTTNNEQRSTEQRKFSFKEKHEFEQLEKEMPDLQKEKALLEEKMNRGSIAYDELQKAAERISTIVQLLDEKEMRWLELSERI